MSQSAVVEVPSTVSGLPTEERILQSVRLHYQTDHQEEFLRLKAQVESLLTEPEQFCDNPFIKTHKNSFFTPIRVDL
jgi:hypothetical protein